MFDLILYQVAGNVNSFGEFNLENFGVLGGLMALFAGFLIAFLIVFALISFALYIYLSLAFMAIAKKAGNPSPGLAFIPIIGPSLICIKSSGRHWWPLLLIIGWFIPFYGLNFLFMLSFSIFFMIWNWKSFENINKPGWWALFLLLMPVWLVFIGVGAWSKS